MAATAAISFFDKLPRSTKYINLSVTAQHPAQVPPLPIETDKLSILRQGWSKESIVLPFSISHTSSASFIVFRFVNASVTRDLKTAFWYCGNAIAANIPIISTTTSNSISVKPFIQPFLFSIHTPTRKIQSQFIKKGNNQQERPTVLFW